MEDAFDALDTKTVEQILKGSLVPIHLEKLVRIDNPQVNEFVARHIELCEPESVFVSTDDPGDWAHIREAAVRDREEAPLKRPNHTVHFDGYHDQARDQENTRYLVDDPGYLGPEINSTDRREGLEELECLMGGIMKGRTMYVRFFSLGPAKSEFAIPCLQLTDSSYLAHTEDILYRHGYEQFVRLGADNKFFRFFHSQGETEEAGLSLRVSKNVKDRRIYIDLKDETVYSINTQYGGNTLGMKKLAMRLAIQRASREEWLTEHMLVMGVNSPRGGRMYFTGAFPSMCGKTSTAMLPGETIIGDDVAFLKRVGGRVRAVNMEMGMFGIIQGINSRDDPIQYHALRSDETHVIFSNVLVLPDGDVYWNDMDGDCPGSGINHSGDWQKGKADIGNKHVPASHKNARFAINLECLANVDPKLHDPQGVEIDGMIYGGRDYDTWVPVEEAFGWAHGIITKGACLESETTAATIGVRGIRVFNPMSNLDFLSVPIGTYIKRNLDFGKKLKKPPKIFGVNYFLRDLSGKFLNQKNDKHVWLKWMALRVEDAVDVIRTPTGLIPRFEDLQELFREMAQKEYTEENYVKQFTFRVPPQEAKLHRIRRIYKKRVKDVPDELFEILEQQMERIEEARLNFGNYISPFELIAERKDYHWELSPHYRSHVARE